jgi:hypothetical protein
LKGWAETKGDRGRDREEK